VARCEKGTGDCRWGRASELVFDVFWVPTARLTTLPLGSYAKGVARCVTSDIQSAAQYHSMLFANTAEPSGNVVETHTDKCSQSSSNNQSGKSAKESHPT
jgi:hypothetical protein